MRVSSSSRLVFYISGAVDQSGSPLGCTTWVKHGAIPNEYGTWLYGRAGWCDGLQVDPWRTDVTNQVAVDLTHFKLNVGFMSLLNV